MASIDALERALLKEKKLMQKNPKTFAELVGLSKRDLFSDEERRAYKARQTAKALEHCRKEYALAVGWQIVTGYIA